MSRNKEIKMAINLVLADPHPVVLDGLVHLFKIEMNFLSNHVFTMLIRP